MRELQIKLELTDLAKDRKGDCGLAVEQPTAAAVAVKSVLTVARRPAACAILLPAAIGGDPDTTSAPVIPD